MDLKTELENKLNLKVILNFKDYKSTYIKIEKTRFQIKISLHKLFENAPEDINEAVINYCTRKHGDSRRILKTYANEYFSKIDNSHKLDKQKLITNGNCFDLKQIYDNLNIFYFQDKLNLNITWFEKPKYIKFSHFTFGTYNKTLKLIKINKLMDNLNFPFYFINYIVYHEMLHSICEEKITLNGQRLIHTKEFKKLEQKFAYYKEALAFEKIFLKKGRKYVRS